MLAVASAQYYYSSYPAYTHHTYGYASPVVYSGYGYPYAHSYYYRK